MAVLKNIWTVNWSFTLKEMYWKNLRALHVLEDLELFLKIFYTFVCKNFLGKIADKYIYNILQTILVGIA